MFEQCIEDTDTDLARITTYDSHLRIAISLLENDPWAPGFDLFWELVNCYCLVTRCQGKLPSGNLTYLWKITMFNGKNHYKWQFSLAMGKHCIAWNGDLKSCGVSSKGEVWGQQSVLFKATSRWLVPTCCCNWCVWDVLKLAIYIYIEMINQIRLQIYMLLGGSSATGTGDRTPYVPWHLATHCSPVVQESSRCPAERIPEYQPTLWIRMSDRIRLKSSAHSPTVNQIDDGMSIRQQWVSECEPNTTTEKHEVFHQRLNGFMDWSWFVTM